MKIPEQTWDKIAAQVLALLTAVLYLGNTVFAWNFGDEKVTAITGVASAFLTLLTVVLYANNSTPNAAVDMLVAGAWRMGQRGTNGGSRTAAAMSDKLPLVEPTRQQVRRYVEHETAA